MSGIASAQTTAVEASEICRAAIASVMGRDPSIMRTRVVDNIQYVSYVRPDDGKVWTYRCRLEGNRVVWAGEQGRWRTHPSDEVITYELSPGGKSVQITEVHEDASKIRKTFPRTKLR